ncbi:hypothetical protein A4A49_02801 [Nicotiana attenuata]|uniref:Uncharacterized protein n=1 Tax=Nicotiana attenuata TaxID=49451 RepID=A0A1J6IHH3_NICAT|nr:hypothetical protein A4A49_02801 [Nicotiana attenuata]
MLESQTICRTSHKNSVLRNILPKVIGIKANCLLGSLAQRQLLIRCDQYEDYECCLVRAVNYIQHNGKEHQYRVFPWTVGYNPKEETSQAAVWVSLPNLSPELFAHKDLLSIAAAGKPIAIDKETQIRTRPSTTRVKVIVDVLDKLPKKVRLQYLNAKTGHEENQCRRLKGKAVQAVRVCDETVENEHQIVEKLQGDARDFLNAKRAGQQLIEGSQRDKNTRQQVCDDLSKGADATGVRDLVQVEKAGGSRGPVVPDRDMNSKGEAASVYMDLEAGQSGKEVIRASTELNPVTIPVSDRGLAGVTKGPRDRQKSDEFGHQTVNAHMLLSAGQAGAILENKTDAPELNKIVDRVASKIDKPTAANIKSAGLQAGSTDTLNEGVKSDNISDKKDENLTMVSSKTGSPNNTKVQQLEQKQGVINRSSNKRRSLGVKEQATTPKNIEFSNSFDALSNEQE